MSSSFAGRQDQHIVDQSDRDRADFFGQIRDPRSSDLMCKLDDDENLLRIVDDEVALVTAELRAELNLVKASRDEAQQTVSTRENQVLQIFSLYNQIKDGLRDVLGLHGQESIDEIVAQVREMKAELEYRRGE